jgi:tricorn protease
MPNKCIAAVAAVALTVGAATAALAVEPHGGMVRYPDVSATHIAFVYANDLWLVPKGGGTAVPLASPPGMESYPRFSPDGGTIAFVGNYDGDVDIYTVPVSGGTAFRVTHHPANELLSEWTNDGRLIFSAYAVRDYPRAQEMFVVSAKGGLPEKLPVPYGALGRIGPDGKWLVYTPYTRDHRTWKRYRGGMATDIWLFNLQDHTSKRITDWEGTDTQPMWHADKIYYLSDAGSEHRLNIWVYDVNTGDKRQVTKYADYDVKWPSLGPGSNGEGEIVFQYGPEIRLLNLGTEDVSTVRITIPGDRPKIREKSVDASEFIQSHDVSSTGKRAVVEARGDIWTLPAKNGSPVDLTRTSGVAERDPSWSPDGKWIAYFSDDTGEYQLYVTQSDGRGETRKLTNGKYGYLYDPVWSPDSKWIGFWDKAGVFYIVNVASAKVRTVDSFKGFGRRRPISWSSDSKWIAYALSDGMIQREAIWLYNVEDGKKHRVTGGMFNDSWPIFDREGKYLYFASNREFSSPMYEDVGNSWIYARTDRLYAVPLTREVPSPVPPKSDDESWDTQGKDEDSKKEKKKDKDEEEDKEDKGPEPVKVDVEGFEARAVQLPVDRGEFSRLTVNDDGKLIYIRGTFRGEEGEPSIHILDVKADKQEDREKLVVSGVRDYAITSDGKKLLVVTRKGGMAIVDAKADQKMEDMVPTTGMTQQVVPREEWRQIFREAWRLQRDYFYDPNMHGVDWDKVYEQYAAMLADCASRRDVSYVIGEMISEMNVGHAYYWGGDVDQAPTVSVGMPGCDFELQNGAYRITRILHGAAWDVDGRGPLSQPGVDVSEGDYLLAVNGVPVDTGKDPWAAFQGLANRTVTLTVSENPKLDDKARYVLVELGAGEYMLRYRAWVEKNRAYVADRTGGRVGYIYVPNTSIWGQNELVRQFFGQMYLDALIIDERWNGGGQVPTRFIELLNRPIANYWVIRDRDDIYPWPDDAHQGPKCMLINGLAGSGGDYFPFWFKATGLGKLVGTRTWGGLVGLSGNPQLIDGGFTSVPTFAFLETNGTWGIEGHGVDPDVEVVDDPAQMYGGKDVQLDAAIDLMLDELKTHPYKKPKRPAYPDRSGMGIKEQDK